MKETIEEIKRVLQMVHYEALYRLRNPHLGYSQRAFDRMVALIDKAKLDERERIKIKLCKKYGVFKYLTLDEVLRALPISKSK